MAFNDVDRKPFRDAAAQGRLLQRVEGQVRRRGLGHARSSRRQAGMSAASWHIAMRLGTAGTAGASPVRWRSAATLVQRRLDRALGLVDRGAGGASLVLAEIVVLLAGVVAPLRVPRAARLVGRARLDPVPLARDAGRGGRAAPRRAHAHDGAGRASSRRGRRASSSRSRSRPRWPSWRWSLRRPANTRTTRRSSRRPRSRSPSLARRRAAGRHRR